MHRFSRSMSSRPSRCAATRWPWSSTPRGSRASEMRRFTRWTNLSEATFLLPPTDAAADYRVRIFTAAGELPFAGHPTLGSCHAWLRAGGSPATRSTSSRSAAPAWCPSARSRAPGVPGPATATDRSRDGRRPVARLAASWASGRGRRGQPVGRQRSGLGGRPAGVGGGRAGRHALGARRRPPGASTSGSWAPTRPAPVRLRGASHLQQRPWRDSWRTR